MSPSISKTHHKIVVCALYKFVSLPDYTAMREPLMTVLLENKIKGTVILAEEGINGTIAGEEPGINKTLTWLQKDLRFADIDYKLSFHAEHPFHRTKVKLKKEIVTMGIDGIDPNKVVGTYVEPQDWNAIISDPKTVLIDTRNTYEYAIGTFKNAINPHTETFREFPQYIKKNLHPQKHKKVALFCTGGIRCEKASAAMKGQGFEEVYHLKGGILSYLERVAPEETLWEGDCFVFDDRVAVNHHLGKGRYHSCHACRYPITEEDQRSPRYLKGVSCPHCHDRLSDEQKERFAEREKQVALAKERGEQHIGSDSRAAAGRHRAQKRAEKQRATR